MSVEEQPKRRGRPPKAEGERKAGNLTIRTYGPLREQLEVAARESGRSISAEVEHRLEQSFWTQAIKAQEQEDHSRFGPEAYLSRLEGMCGGPAGLSFAVTLGDALRRLRKKIGVPAKAEVIDLSEDQRRELMLALASVLPAQFGLWEERSATAVADMLGVKSSE